MSTVSELSEFLESAKERRALVTARIAEIDAERAALEKESKALYSSGWGAPGGVIPDLQSKIAAAKQVEHDATLRSVVFLIEGHGRYDDPRPWIVDKVTPKRIFVREVGCARSEQYDRVTGKHQWRKTIIDIAATFPEGVDNFKTNRMVEKVPVR